MVPMKSLTFLALVTYDSGADVEAGTDPACNDAVIEVTDVAID